MKVRRVVTGHTPEGKATFASDTEVDGIELDLIPGAEFHRLWGGDERSVFPDAGMGELEEKLPGLAGHMEPDNPGMHTTDTIDFE